MEPLLGSIFYWPLSWAPQGFALCQGQLLSITQYTALYSLLNTTYGGDGKSTFGLPDLRGRIPLHHSNATEFQLGKKAGVENVTLSENEMPSHSHSLNPDSVNVRFDTATMPPIPIEASLPATTAAGTFTIPGSNAVPATAPDLSSLGLGIDYNMYGSPDGLTTMPVQIKVEGGVPLNLVRVPTIGKISGQVSGAGNFNYHQNMQPFLVINFIIALAGIYPGRPGHNNL